MGKIGRKMMWLVAGKLASRAVRGATSRAIHTPYGRPRLPRRVRARSGVGTGLAWVAGAAVAFAVADMLQEQARDAMLRR